ncbi:Iron-sulfur assembly protein 1 [Termitomyces sp. T112]|nr:Iron-sulfur assembly protein 1 [Termitomyces sp. T112]
MASRHSALPFLYPCCTAFAAVPTRRAMMSAFRSQPGSGLPTSLATPPDAPSTSTSSTPIASTPGVTLNADAAAPQVAARPPPLPKVEKARPKIRASKAALTITPRAVARLQSLLKGPTPQLIRIGVRNKGCAGLSYHLEYVESAGKFDEVVEQDGVQVLIDSKALFSIIGSEMDWGEDALSSKFSFKNPNITDACGCGESFTVR